MSNENQAPEGGPTLSAELVEKLARETGAFIVRDGFPEHEGAEFDTDAKLMAFALAAALAAQPQSTHPADQSKSTSAIDTSPAEGERDAGLIDNLLMSLDQIARDRDIYAYGLPIDCSATDGPMEEMRQKVRATIAALQPQPKGTQVPADLRFSWMDFQQIGELPAVDEAIRSLLNDQTEDNGVCMIRAICEAAADRLVALAAPAPGIDVGIPLIERLMRVCTNLGISYEGGYEHFRARFEDNLYAICRGVDSLLASLNQAPAVTPASAWVWTHKTKGGEYTHLGRAQLQTDAPLGDMAELVVYQGANGGIWARAADEFADRFKRIPKLAGAAHAPAGNES